MRPVVKVNEKDGDILIADSGEPFFGTNDAGVLGRWYRTGYALDRGDQVWVASTNVYDAVEYDTVSRREGQQDRVNDCLEHARNALSQISQSGLFNA
jgi:hypothetical protein